MKKKAKGRNPIASALKSPHLKPKIKNSKKIYKRKARTKKDEEA